MPIKIHIADDHAVFRCGLKAFIEKQNDMVVTGETGDVFETLKSVKENNTDVLVLDISMPGMPAAELAKDLRVNNPQIGILILTIHDEEYYLKEFLKLGVKGFMVKTSSGDDLIRAIRLVKQGHQYIDPLLASYLVTGYLGRKLNKGTIGDELTIREQEVCIKLALGYTNSEVADSLTISKRTVETHRAAIMTKLKLKNRAELVRFALDNGLLKS